MAAPEMERIGVYLLANQPSYGSAIADELDMHRANVASRIHRLEELGLVKRGDLSVKPIRVSLTDEGEQFFDAFQTFENRLQEVTG